jgi:hypothetical protein
MKMYSQNVIIIDVMFLCNAHFASKVNLFQKTLEDVHAINIYFTWSSFLQSRVPNGFTWAIAQVVIETLNLVVHQCVLNKCIRLNYMMHYFGNHGDDEEGVQCVLNCYYSLTIVCEI